MTIENQGISKHKEALKRIRKLCSSAQDKGSAVDKFIKSRRKEAGVEELKDNHECTALFAKNNFGILLEAVQAHPVKINKHGRPVAYFLSAEEYERLKSNKQT